MVSLARQLHVHGAEGEGAILPPGLLCRVQARAYRFDTHALLWRRGAYVSRATADGAAAFGCVVERRATTDRGGVRLRPALGARGGAGGGVERGGGGADGVAV